MGDLLEVRHLCKSFGGVLANRDISICVPSGGIVGVIGPNGSGKSTLFSAIVGYHPIDSGSIRFRGQEISRLPVCDIARLGLMRTFQQSRVFRKLNCMQNMQLGARQSCKGASSVFARPSQADSDQAERLLEFVGIHDKRFHLAGELSFGQQKLLELAMALMDQPTLLLLDEPTAGINPTLINALMERLRRVNVQFGITLLIIEHNMRVIMELAQHIYCLAHGELLASGPPESIQSDRRVVDAYLGRH